MSVTITGLSAFGAEITNALKVAVKEASQITYEEVKKATPIKSGNARRNWQQKVDDTSFQVVNTVPYIERLEKGSSKQAPRGIITPALTQVKGRLK